MAEPPAKRFKTDAELKDMTAEQLFAEMKMEREEHKRQIDVAEKKISIGQMLAGKEPWIQRDRRDDGSKGIFFIPPPSSLFFQSRLRCNLHC